MVDEPLHMNVPYPVPTPVHAAVLGSYHLALELAAPALQVRIPGRPGELFLEDWQIARAAFLARMTGTLRHLGYLVPSMSRLDGAALCRTLLDHAINYVWIADNPAERLPRFLRGTYDEALKHHRRFADLGDELLAPGLLRHYERFRDTHRGPPGNLRAVAVEADVSWYERASRAMPEPMELVPLTTLYSLVYGPFANLDHPSPAGLQTYVHLSTTSSAAWVDGEPERDRDGDLGPYWLALWSYFWALTVCSISQGQPRLSDLRQVMSTVRGVREFERNGLLTASVHGGAIQLGVVDDVDARIDAIAAERDRPR